MVRAATAPDARLLDLFLDMLAAERGAAANTLAAYRRDLDNFTQYLTSKRATIATASSDDLRGHLAGLAKKGFKASSIARRLDRKSTRLNSSHLGISYAVF